MAAEKKTIVEFERERGLVLTGKVSPTKKVTSDEFDELTKNDANWVGVDYEFRERWLKDNGYKITRKNLIDTTLMSKQAREEQE